jgi:small GTP-binding protein
MTTEPNSIDLKVVVLGAASVGKTSIIHRYCNGTFRSDLSSTVGAGFFTHTYMVGDMEVTLLLWDTAGEERYKSFAGLYSQAASAGIICFDVTDSTSFEEVSDWIRLFQENAEKGAILVLVGNKNDLIEERQVTEEAAKLWAGEHSLTYFDVSAKTGEHIDLLFAEVANRVGPKMTTDCLAMPSGASRPKEEGCGC